jgi:hypothetical protein
MPARAEAAAFAPRDVVSHSLTIWAARAGTMLICSGAVLRLPVAGRMFPIANVFSLHSGPLLFQKT